MEGWSGADAIAYTPAHVCACECSGGICVDNTTCLTWRRLIAGIFAALLIESRVEQCVSAVTIAGDLVARSTGVGVRGGPYAHPLAL